MLSNRHYEAIAEIVDSVTVHRPAYPRDPIIYRDDLVKHLAAYFFEDNPRFDVERFKAACLFSEAMNTTQDRLWGGSKPPAEEG